MALGPTHYNWRPDVARVVRRVNSQFPAVRANTYVGHPWLRDPESNGWGWEHVSVDFWGSGGRGFPIRHDVGFRLLKFLWDLPGEPYIRHYIFLHTLWTSFGGKSYWSSNDHSGALRHLHVTYWL